MSAPRGHVLLVDDDQEILRVVGRSLTAHGYSVRAFGSAEGLLEAIEGPVPSPACLVLDVRLPDLNGLALQHLLAERGTYLPIVFISAHVNVPATVSAIRSGAVDFLMKPFDTAQLVAAVSAALERSQTELAHRTERDSARRRLARLTGREAEVLRLVVAGRSGKEIAAALGITERTVKLHRGNVGRKLGCRSAVALVRLVETAAARERGR